jgi:hypothetical protein
MDFHKFANRCHSRGRLDDHWFGIVADFAILFPSSFYAAIPAQSPPPFNPDYAPIHPFLPPILIRSFPKNIYLPFSSIHPNHIIQIPNANSNSPQPILAIFPPSIFCYESKTLQFLSSSLKVRL